ncbi:MAG TPA: hypothetical protein VN695_00155 [Streptosporangiaceae bacterium]|nr:hypothetical protein [Streptosporangiaceae bacterium]
MRVVVLSGQPGARREADTEQPVTMGPMGGSDQPQRSSRLRDAFGAKRAKQQAHADDLRQASAGVVNAARKSGAQHAVKDLQAELGDDWMLVRGYQNSSGRIGQLLLGTHGVVALTSLSLDATVRCHGDKWRAERVDKNGQSLGEINLDDENGRSPSAQLNHAADELQRFLRSSGFEATVLRAVLLNHFRSRVEGGHRATVQIFTSHYELGDWLRKLPKVLDRGQRRKLEELLTGSRTDR